MKQFRKHPNPSMGIFVEQQMNLLFGENEIEFAFNRAEQSELDAEYTAWLNSESAPDDEAQPSTDAG